MSDPLALVRTRLLAISAVTALVASRIYNGFLPQSPTPPMILLRLIDRVTDSHLRGQSAVAAARVQVHHAATTREGAMAVAAAVEGAGDGTAFSHFSGPVGSGRIAAVLPGGVDREEYHANELLRYEVVRDYVVHFE